MTKGDTEFAYPIGTCTVPVINRDFTLKLNNGGNPFSFSGPISGSGKVEIYAGGPNAPLMLDGKAPNTMQGTWPVKSGTRCARQATRHRCDGRHDHRRAATAISCGKASNQLDDAATVQLLGSEKSGASLNLNGFSDTIAGLTMATGAKVLTNGRRRCRFVN